MIKKTTRALCIVMMLGLLLTMGAFAAEVSTAPEVRVNGTLVSFPDAGPFIDENNRTMIPVRFVAENLGGNRFKAETRGVKSFRLYLAPAMGDLARPFTVVFPDGRKVTRRATPVAGERDYAAAITVDAD